MKRKIQVVLDIELEINCIIHKESFNKLLCNLILLGFSLINTVEKMYGNNSEITSVLFHLYGMISRNLKTATCLQFSFLQMRIFVEFCNIIQL